MRCASGPSTRPHALSVRRCLCMCLTHFEASTAGITRGPTHALTSGRLCLFSHPHLPPVSRPFPSHITLHAEPCVHRSQYHRPRCLFLLNGLQGMGANESQRQLPERAAFFLDISFVLFSSLASVYRTLQLDRWRRRWVRRG